MFQQVRAAGLMDRRPGYYIVKITLTVAALAAGWAGLFVVGDSWVALAVALFLGLASTQVVFVGHDAGHHQIFSTRRANGLVGLAVGNLLTGLSFGWWVPKHGAHHANPNTEDRDPDIGAGVIAFTAAHAQSRRGFSAWAARHQAALFFPLLFLEAIGLHVASIRSLAKRQMDRAATVETLLLIVHVALYLTAIFWVLSPARAIAFIAVQQGTFGFYLGCSFAPNHKGMPIIGHDSRLSFAHRQVLTARNVSGGRLGTFMLGGLDYQIEHHLFPTMPRPNLRKAQPLVRAFCANNGLPYSEATPFGSYRETLRHLRVVGSGHSPDPAIPKPPTRRELTGS
jgi:fatty acid desaturase